MDKWKLCDVVFLIIMTAGWIFGLSVLYRHIL